MAATLSNTEEECHSAWDIMQSYLSVRKLRSTYPASILLKVTNDAKKEQ